MKHPLRRPAPACLVGLLLLCAAAPLLANESPAVERFGIIIGINEGGPTRAALRFATSDAQAFAAVMQDMGGLAPANRVMLLNPMLDDVTQAFADMTKKIGAAKGEAKRREFILYYSGHSDEEGLLIGEQRLGYKELRALIAAVPAEVRIAVIDSCASGVFIRTKGGTPKPPFLVDSAVEMKGYAFLTSSAETEAAQESDNIGASFFTHFLVSGLRGAADASRDGVVTLNEAYQYAFNETLVRTEKTQYGPQHPSYDIQLTGTGDLVLTDLRETSASLLIEEAVTGRIYIRDAQKKLVVELNKQEKGSLEIGLEAGAYTVLVDSSGSSGSSGVLSQAGIRLVTGRRAVLRASDLVAVRPESTVKRGEEGEGGNEAESPAAAKAESAEPAAPEAGDEYVRQTRFFRFTVFPTLITRLDSNIQVTNYLVLNLTVGRAQFVKGAAVGIVGSIVENDLSGYAGSTFFNIVNGRMAGAETAAIFNIAGGPAGFLQAAGVFNIASRDFAGAQLAGVFNVCNGNVSGLQSSAVLNTARDVAGVQIGLFNAAKKVTGLQIGLINISEDNEGVALGLVNVSKNGIHDVEVWQDSGNFTNAAFKLGTKYSYGILLGGCDFIDDDRSWYAGAGFGFRIPIEPIFIDIDALMTARYRESQDPLATAFETTLLPQMRLKVGFRIFGIFALFAGVNVQVFIPGLLYDPAYMTGPSFDVPIGGSGQPVTVVPRFFFGIQLF
jgi:hypothetical protein